MMNDINLEANDAGQQLSHGMSWQEHGMLLLHYSFASVLFAIYGHQVCKVMETYSAIHLMFPMFIAYSIRLALTNTLLTQPFQRRVTISFSLDLGLFAAASLGLVVINYFVFGAPWHSNIKAVIGIVLLGLFVSTLLALSTERNTINEMIATNQHLKLGKRFLSFVNKFTVMAIVLLVALGGVLFLVINQDLYWLLDSEVTVVRQEASAKILFEIAVIITVLMSYAIAIILSYTGNLTTYLHHQTRVMEAVANGDLSQQVPVVSRDEFGQMATGTNLMINGLLDYQSQLKVTRDASILALASLAETRDNETGAHILRTQRYVKVLAEQLAHHDDFREMLNPEIIELYYKSAPLHDVGKVGIVDSILLKPGKLTDDEFEIMKTHPQIGNDALLVAEKQLGSNSFLRYAREIALSHHEKWDGSGYPNKLVGDDIPLSGRLMALADVYDALLSKRVYKPAFSHDKAKAIILQGRGGHFDPRVVAAFEACEQQFIDIAAEFKDGSSDH